MKKMKKIILLLLTIITLSSCGETTINNNKIKYENGIVMYSGKKFTGTTVNVSVKGMVFKINNYENGKITSLERYSKIIMDDSNYNIMKLDGKKIPINKFKIEEVKDGYSTKFYPQSTNIREKFEIKFKPSEYDPTGYVKNGVYQKFDEKGVIIEEKKFLDGKIIQ